MSTDTRTPAEVEYDRLALSTRTPADQGPFGVDPGIDAMIAVFERLEALEDEPADTPIATLPGGAAIVGTYEHDGSHSCVVLRAEDGHFYYSDDSVLSGDWAGFYFEELTLAQVEKLRALFNGPMLTALVDAARSWCVE
jgi:hypothetical protein